MNPAASAFSGRQPRRLRVGARCWSLCVLVVGLVAGLMLPVSPAAAVAGFGDVDDDVYYTEPVQWMVNDNIVADTTGPCFAPHTSATRGETALYIWRMEGEPEAPPHPFTDVTDDDQQPAVSWMYETGDHHRHHSHNVWTRPAPDQSSTRGVVASTPPRISAHPHAHPDQSSTRGVVASTSR